LRYIYLIEKEGGEMAKSSKSLKAGKAKAKPAIKARKPDKTLKRDCLPS
jgi:hypothetical protein